MCHSKNVHRKNVDCQQVSCTSCIHRPINRDPLENDLSKNTQDGVDVESGIVRIVRTAALMKNRITTRNISPKCLVGATKSSYLCNETRYKLRKNTYQLSLDSFQKRLAHGCMLYKCTDCWQCILSSVKSECIYKMLRNAYSFRRDLVTQCIE